MGFFWGDAIGGGGASQGADAADLDCTIRAGGAGSRAGSGGAAGRGAGGAGRAVGAAGQQADTHRAGQGHGKKLFHLHNLLSNGNRGGSGAARRPE